MIEWFYDGLGGVEGDDKVLMLRGLLAGLQALTNEEMELLLSGRGEKEHNVLVQQLSNFLALEEYCHLLELRLARSQFGVWHILSRHSGNWLSEAIRGQTICNEHIETDREIKTLCSYGHQLPYVYDTPEDTVIHELPQYGPDWCEDCASALLSLGRKINFIFKDFDYE